METYCAIIMASADILDGLGWYGATMRANQLRRIAKEKWPTDYADEMQWRTNPDRKKCIHCDAFADSCEHRNRPDSVAGPEGMSARDAAGADDD